MLNALRTRILFIALVVFSAVVFPLAAQPKTFGIGIILGEPTGISAKLWLDRTSAIDAAAAWTFYPNGAFYVHADYLYHMYDLFPVTRGVLPLYIGVGGSVTIEPVPRIGVRVPIGIDYFFEKAPIDIFLEVAPGISLYPATQFDASGGIGVRFNF
ncbi:MAG TPA: hypothetical protein VMW87_11600 [Spirochaetia bacterium]|nr:hypothetical protein [Spirochaetia bacterium]